MLKNSYKGQNITELIIILALVAVLAIIALTTLGGNVNIMFSKSSKKVDAYKPFNWELNNNNVSESTIEPGKLGGNINKPVKKCYNSICVIDFGNFVLTGIPEEFNDFVQTVGTSGTSDKLASLLYSIAEQLEQMGLQKDSLEVKKLASIGHNIASVENVIESNMNKCKGDINCLLKFNNMPFPKPEGFDETFVSFPTNAKFGLYDYYAVTIGNAEYTRINNPEVYKNLLKTGNLSFLFNNQLSKVTGSTNIPDNMKGVIKELSWDLGHIGEEFNNNCNFIGVPEKETQTYFDPETGEKINVNKPLDYNLDSFTDYKASSITHFDSSLICATGYNKDTGTKCH